MIGGIPPATREILQRVAVVGASFDTDELVALSGLPDEEAFDHLDAALAARVIEHAPTGYRFRHRLVRDALLEDVPLHRRRRIHQDAATRLAKLGASPARVGYHLLHGGDPTRAVPYVLSAAETEAAVGAFRDALDLLDTVRWHAAGANRSRFLALRVDLLMTIGDPTAAAAYREALESAAPVARRRLRARLARPSVMARRPGHCDRGPRGCRAGRRRRRRDPARAGTSRLLRLGPRAGLVHRRDRPPAGAGRRQELAGPRPHRAPGDARTQPGRVVRSDADRAATHTRHAEIANAVFDGYLCPAEYLLYGPTPYAEVIDVAIGLRMTAQRSGALRAVAFATALIGEAALLSGDLDLASRESQEAVDLHHDLGSTAGEAHSLQRLAEVRVAQDERAEATRLLWQALPLARWSMIAPHLLQRIYGTMIAAAPDPAAARAVVDRAESTLGIDDACAFCSVMLSVPATIACADSGDVDHARQHLAIAEHSAKLWEGTAWEAWLAEAVPTSPRRG